MVEVERLILAGVSLSKTECFRLGPSFERRLAIPSAEVDVASTADTAAVHVERLSRHEGRVIAGQE